MCTKISMHKNHSSNDTLVYICTSILQGNVQHYWTSIINSLAIARRSWIENWSFNRSSHSEYLYFRKAPVSIYYCRLLAAVASFSIVTCEVAANILQWRLCAMPSSHYHLTFDEYNAIAEPKPFRCRCNMTWNLEILRGTLLAIVTILNLIN